LNPFRRSLRFILAQQTGKISFPVSVNEVHIKAGAQKLRTKIFTPPAPEAQPIVLLHGMSLLGVDDPRQVRAVNALAAAGFRIICPELPEIRDIQIKAKSIATFIAFVSEILRRSDCTRTGRLALFAPSFSGAIVLRAAAAPGLRDHIAAVCALGTMAGIRASMNHILLGQGIDSYARFIVLANYVKCKKKYAPLAGAFRALAVDNWHETASINPLMPGIERTHYAAAAFKKIAPAQRRLVEKIVGDDGARGRIFEELMPLMERELRAYGVLDVAEDITAPTFLLHGKNDDVIPPQESIELARRLKSSRLVISPFIGHADTAVSLRLVGDIGRLISGFAYFFKNASR
jgi:pimeloyl-ACP methyl ester carboxylesterase